MHLTPGPASLPGVEGFPHVGGQEEAHLASLAPFFFFFKYTSGTFCPVPRKWLWNLFPNIDRGGPWLSVDIPSGLQNAVPQKSRLPEASFSPTPGTAGNTLITKVDEKNGEMGV